MEHANRSKYAGIGSRQTPPHICTFFKNLASILEENDFVLRSGAADGADSAFESGIKNPDNKEIFLPWESFNNHSSNMFPNDECFRIAEHFHPKWSKLSSGAKKLHARNIKQILGDDLDDPVDFVLCWTIDGETIGGTATAIKLAESLDVPVLNFGKYSEISDMIFKFTIFMETVYDI